jgi:hypothetical protein
MNKKLIAFELLWLMISCVIIIIVLLPIYTLIGASYPFYFENATIIFLAITFSRYIFLIKHHWISYSNWIKGAFIFIPIPIFIFLMDSLYDFQALYDEYGIASIMEELPFKTQKTMGLYIRTQMIFFWAAAFISNAMMPFRMLISIWKRVNKGVD